MFVISAAPAAPVTAFRAISTSETVVVNIWKTTMFRTPIPPVRVCRVAEFAQFHFHIYPALCKVVAFANASWSIAVYSASVGGALCAL